ncbi:hypothetical protein MalM25_00600 [Planctomycetes bacterium MalM25]|nr:hypothetical protein MalM25_00600 [Planctomycetes bacterium MalM25]
MIAVAALAVGLGSVGVSHGQSTPSLQGRLDALAQQVHLRHQHYEPALTAHRQHIRAVLEEWNRTTGGEASADNRALMANWIDRAMRSIMPGGSGELPAAPRFLKQPEPVVAKRAPAERSLTKQTTPAADVEPAPPAIVPPNTGARANGPAQVVRTSATERRSVAKPIAPAAEAAGPARSPARSKWSRRPSAAPLEWRDPFADDPAASPNPLRSGQRRTSRRPSFDRSAGATINRAQLAAEVRGYNAALRELQLAVIEMEESDVFGLADAAERLERLEEQRQFLDLYRQGLPASERGWLPESPSSELVRELVRRKAERLTKQTPPREKSRRRALENLTARLARLAGQSER